MRSGGAYIAALALCAACSFNPGGGGDNDRLEDLPDADPNAVDAAGSGTDASPQNQPDGGSQCSTNVSLIASKTYNPSDWDLGSANLPSPLRFTLPGTFDVSQGNAANHCSRFEYGIGSDVTVCAYKGGASVAHVGSDPTQINLGQTYHLVECRDTLFSGFPACGESANGNIVSAAQFNADHLNLLVNGDDQKGLTRVALNLTGQCP